MMLPSAQIIDISPVADLIVGTLLAVKPHEEVLLIADTESHLDMVYALAGAARRIGCEYAIATMPSRRGHAHLAHVLPRSVAKAFEGADVAIGLTRGSFAPSLAPVQTRLVFQEKRLRYYSMAFRETAAMMCGGALADYAGIRATAGRLTRVMAAGRELTVRTARGTDFCARIPHPGDEPAFDGPFVRVEDGWAVSPGDEAAFPDGEVFFAPGEFSACGRLVVDGPIEYVGLPVTPLDITVEKGRIVRVGGDSAEARTLRHILATVVDADIIGEVAVGINPCSLRDGSAQEEKKALGNVHIGFGIARPFPGSWMAKHQLLIHSDMVIRDAVVAVDGRTIVKNDRVCIPGDGK